ncbi:hypothetical protein DY000_02007734 [Brassica cretica]|uniref:Uncharacterized protein n=1 Tax=Brassica cretica TaxID=69181 RepID=A0ABQ7C605_BRACR|nr:hypothetical protein DY000_02007734 [Brassica cretica]
MFFRETKETEEDIRRMFHQVKEKMRQRITLNKKSYPEKFVVPCLIGGIEYPSVLCDTGSSVSILPKVMASQIDWYCPSSSRLPCSRYQAQLEFFSTTWESFHSYFCYCDHDKELDIQFQHISETLEQNIDRRPSSVDRRPTRENIDTSPKPNINQHSWMDVLLAYVIELEPIEERVYEPEVSHPVVPKHLRQPYQCKRVSLFSQESKDYI